MQPNNQLTPWSESFLRIWPRSVPQFIEPEDSQPSLQMPPPDPHQESDESSTQPHILFL